MRAWLRCVGGGMGLALVGLIVALAVVVSRGQELPGQVPQSGEPPMVGAPTSPQSPALPTPAFTPPSPTPLPPEQSAPFVPALPPQEPPMPLVRLRVQAPARVVADKEIEYRLIVENVSGAAAHHVLVRDRLPRGVEETVRAKPEVTDQKKTKDGDTDLLWELGTLKPGDQKVIVLAIKPKGTEDVQNRAYVQFEHGQKVTTRIVKPSVQVKAAVAPQAALYESVRFSIDIANTGATPLRNVVVSDELPAGMEFVSGKPEPKPEKPLTWKVGDVPPRQSYHIEYQAISKQAGTFRNQVKVTADGGAKATGSAAVTVGEAKLKVSIDGPQRRAVKRPIPYLITVHNHGTLPVANVQVSDELPGGIDFVRADSGGRREGGFVRWSLGNLPPGELRSVRVILSSPKSGWCWNEAAVRAVRTSSVGRNEEMADKALSGRTRIDPAVAPVVEIDKDISSLAVGQKATYTIRLYNPGKNNVLHPSVIVAVPDEMGIRGQRGPTTGQQQGQLIRFDPLGALNSGQEETYFIEVEAKKSGEAKLKAWWTDGRQDTASPDTWEDKTTILDPSRTAVLTTKTQSTQKGKTKEESCTSPRDALAGF